MTIPDYITHYYLADRQPFLSLSELNLEKHNSIFDELLNRHKIDPSYHRRYGKNYIDTRKKIENILRYYFIKRGGKPTRKYPFYFVLGESLWFKHLNQNHSEIKIPVKELNPATVSFTFPDSYIALSSNTKPYHGKVFLLNDLENVVAQYGLPIDDTSLNYDSYWLGDFEKYIEFQVWENEIIQPFIDLFFEKRKQARPSLLSE